MDRRTFLTLIGAASAAPSIPWADEIEAAGGVVDYSALDGCYQWYVNGVLKQVGGNFLEGVRPTDEVEFRVVMLNGGRGCA